MYCDVIAIFIEVDTQLKSVSVGDFVWFREQNVNRQRSFLAFGFFVDEHRQVRNPSWLLRALMAIVVFRMPTDGAPVCDSKEGGKCVWFF